MIGAHRAFYGIYIYMAQITAISKTRDRISSLVDNIKHEWALFMVINNFFEVIHTFSMKLKHFDEVI